MVARDLRECGPAQAIAQRRVFQKVCQIGGEGRHVSGIGQEAGLAALHQGRHPAAAPGDHRQAGRLGFQQGHAVGFVDGRPGQEVAAGE
jgi:hypothetical protein